MANWIRRSAQIADCPDPDNTACATLDQGTTPTVAATSGFVLEGTAEVTQLPTAVNSASNNAEVITSTVGTNLDGGVWTSFFTVTPTTVFAEPTTTTTPSVVTDVSEAQATSKSSSSDSGISKGAVAGIAIGTCIVGAAIAFIVAWLLFKRRDRKFVQKTCPSGYPIYADSSPELVMVQKSAATGSPYVQVSQTQMRTPVPVPARVLPSPTGGALTGLPPAAGEHDVQTRVSALFEQIHRHIDTYYRDVHASITPSMDYDLASFGKGVDVLELLQNCSQPTVALRHALVAFVLGIAGPKTEGFKQTLWPDELTRCLCLEQNVPSPGMASLDM